MKEIKVLLISMLNNLIVSSLKIIGGIFCHNNSLMADGFHTFSDFITDIIAIIGTKISKKRANKRYPFGYGNIEYITSIFIGIIIFSLGIFIIIKSIFSTPHETNNMAIVIILIAIILKLLSANYLMKKGTEYHSQILITSSKESFTDLYSSIVVLIIIFISSFQNIVPLLKYTDMIGSIILGLIILKTSIVLVKNNGVALLGQTEDSPIIYNYVKDIINEYNEIEFDDLMLIKNGSYYQANIEVICKKNMNVNRLLKIEKNIKKRIKQHKIGIRFIDIDIVQEKKS